MLNVTWTSRTDRLKALKALKASLRKAPAERKEPRPEAPEPDFKHLFADVRPLKDNHRVHFPMPRPGVRPRRQADANRPDERPHQAIGWFEPPDVEQAFKRPGMQTGTLRRLRGGHWPVCAELDLHGMDRVSAQDHLAVFLHRARARGNCVRIIHGKGIGSRGEPILKRMTRAWLMHHPDVLAYCEISGGGALLVLLRRPTE